MGEASASRFRYSIHGQSVDLTCDVPRVIGPMGKALGTFTVAPTPSVLGAIQGTLQPYDAEEVCKRLSSTATRVPGTSDLVEIYEEDERFWLIDDRWGLCELNPLKGHFRSWILGESAAIKDANRIVEQAVMWPLSQLLRPRGLNLLPVAGVVRDGWGAMLMSSFSIEPELRTLARAGWKIVGQSWAAIREERGNLTMLSMPSPIERSAAMNRPASKPEEGSRVDLMEEFFGCGTDRAGLDAVLLIAPGRRPLPDLQHILPTNAMGSLRRDWPITELHPQRRHGQLPARIAQRIPIFDARLSRNARDILALLEKARYRKPATPRVTVYVDSKVRSVA